MRDQQKRRFDAVKQTLILSKEEVKELNQSEWGNHFLLIGYKIAYSFAYRGQSYEKQEYIYFRTLTKAERKKLRDLEVGDDVQVLFQKQNPKASRIDFQA
ncbi:MAG: hypothetical protein AAFU64_11555 [Bacteroidota bacterium]